MKVYRLWSHERPFFFLWPRRNWMDLYATGYYWLWWYIEFKERDSES